MVSCCLLVYTPMGWIPVASIASTTEGCSHSLSAPHFSISHVIRCAAQWWNLSSTLNIFLVYSAVWNHSTHSCDYAAHFCGSVIGSGIVPTPKSCDFGGFCPDCVRLNFGHNLVNNGHVIIVSWPNIVTSVFDGVIFCFGVIQCVIFPAIAFFLFIIWSFIGVLTRISFTGAIVVIVHYWNGGQESQAIRYVPNFVANVIEKYQ